MRFKTDVALDCGGKALPAGEYSMFIGLDEREWTLVLSSWPAQQQYDSANKAEAYNYTPDRDVLRVMMKLDALPYSVDEFTIAFVDMTRTSGRLAVMWDQTMGSVAFKMQ